MCFIFAVCSLVEPTLFGFGSGISRCWLFEIQIIGILLFENFCWSARWRRAQNGRGISHLSAVFTGGRLSLAARFCLMAVRGPCCPKSKWRLRKLRALTSRCNGRRGSSLGTVKAGAYTERRLPYGAAVELRVRRTEAAAFALPSSLGRRRKSLSTLRRPRDYPIKFTE